MWTDDEFLSLVLFFICIDVLGDVSLGNDLVLGVFLVKCNLARLGEPFFLTHGFVLAAGSFKNQYVCIGLSEERGVSVCLDSFSNSIRAWLFALKSALFTLFWVFAYREILETISLNCSCF